MPRRNPPQNIIRIKGNKVSFWYGNKEIEVWDSNRENKADTTEPCERLRMIYDALGTIDDKAGLNLLFHNGCDDSEEHPVHLKVCKKVYELDATLGIRCANAPDVYKKAGWLSLIYLEEQDVPNVNVFVEVYHNVITCVSGINLNGCDEESIKYLVFQFCRLATTLAMKVVNLVVRAHFIIHDDSHISIQALGCAVRVAFSYQIERVTDV